MTKNIIVKTLYPLIAFLLITLPFFSPLFERLSAGLAVISGIILSIFFQNPYKRHTELIASKLLTWSVIGLGFGMNLITVANVGINGIGYTIIGILLTFSLGILLGKILNNNKDMSVLITFGTAICGGSAIAALAPTIKANNHDISVSLAIIFVLNAMALFIFPPLGSYLNLTQEQFGLWSALAIHDTSSVIGATLVYGVHSLEVGTTVKLARALWIVPITLIVGIFYAKYFHQKNSDTIQKFKKPWFILGFLLAAALVTWIPYLREPGQIIRTVAEKMLIVTLFCIGANLSRAAIKSVGFRPFIQGFLLWFIMATCTLCAIYLNIIKF
ncbi:YeiH family protein [Fluviispira multicolorata]|uniref:YeiH family protein n=1 Tax=Fluviispira multicolorata TaxID=2654512 RepID=UPI001375F660|nr:putative sulfate exporter family transporter [Fluviispira multicolorata]